MMSRSGFDGKPAWAYASNALVAKAHAMRLLGFRHRTIAAALGQPRSTVTCWLAGHRRTAKVERLIAVRIDTPISDNRPEPSTNAPDAAPATEPTGRTARPVAQRPWPPYTKSVV